MFFKASLLTNMSCMSKNSSKNAILCNAKNDLFVCGQWATSLVPAGRIEIYCWYQWKEQCPNTVTRRNNSAPSFVPLGRIVIHCWYEWEDQCPNIGTSKNNNSPSNVGTIGKNIDPLLVTLGRSVMYCWSQWEEQCPNIGSSRNNSATLM